MAKLRKKYGVDIVVKQEPNNPNILNILRPSKRRFHEYELVDTIYANQ